MWQALVKQTENEPPSLCLREWKIAGQCEAAFDWAGAEAAYKRAIESEEVGSPLATRGQSHLAGFYSLVGRDEEAFGIARAMTQAARRSEGWMRPRELSQSLRAEASWRLKRGEVAQARALAEESLRELEGQPHLEMLARRARLLRAECDIAGGDLEAASRDLDELWLQLEPWQNAGMFAGWQGTLALWWRARALYWEKAGQDEAEIEAWRQVVHFQRVLTQAPQLDGPYQLNGLAFAVRSLGRALERAGSPLAAHAFGESRSLRSSIGLPEIMGG